jgi:AMMECR1 domain-containing protein
VRATAIKAAAIKRRARRWFIRFEGICCMVRGCLGYVSAMYGFGKRAMK